MVNEVLAALENVVGLWVCKKDASSHPALLGSSDIHDLAMATKAGISGPVSREGEREWGNLRELTKDWIVQQKPGTEPGPLQRHDFEHLASLISPVLPTPEVTAESVTSQAQPDSANSVQSDVDRWTREAPDLTFAREHLERCL